jgi:hypothetical protein
MKSVFAARQRLVAGDITKSDFNRILVQWLFPKWVALAKETQPEWRWLCELGCYLELKHHGVE